MTVKRLVSLLVILVGVALVGCGSPAASTPPSVVRPITEILDSGPDFTDVGPTTARIVAVTRIPVVCAAVYGTTNEYGQMATDTDMAGGGHQDHHPLLTGLQPNTLYYVRLMGVGPEGLLYRSDEYTFRTSVAEAISKTENLALSANGARIVGVSSNYGGGSDNSSFGALNAIDGNPATQWSSDGDGDKAWIELELVTSAHIAQVGLWSRTMGDSAEIRSFQIRTETGQTVGPFELKDAESAHYFGTDLVAQRLRFEVLSSTGGNTGVVEIELYANPD